MRLPIDGLPAVRDTTSTPSAPRDARRATRASLTG
jgi:hypothetical protein